MNDLNRFLRVWRDDNGQAMTEFVIIVPIVVFLFALVLQTVMIAQVAQMMNYAAFSAARSYATSYSKEKAANSNSAIVGHQNAVRKAEFAASFAMAPVSGAVHGEGLSAWNPLRRGADASRKKINATLYRVAEGMVISRFYRMKNFRIVKQPSNGERETDVIRCTFDYMCPIDVPGIAELWNYLFERDQQQSGKLGVSDTRIEVSPYFRANANNFVENTLTLADLNTIIADAEAIAAQFASRLGLNFSVNLNSFRNKPYASGEFKGAPINILLAAKSAVGFEPWSGILSGPADPPPIPPDPECQKEIDRRTELKNIQGVKSTNACNNALVKSNTWWNAKKAKDTCLANNPPNNCADEISDQRIKGIAYYTAQAICTVEAEKLDEANNFIAEYQCPSVNSDLDSWGRGLTWP